MSTVTLSLSQLMSVLSLDTMLSNDDVDAVIHGFQIDTRQIMPGDVFVALVGERVDGHDFVALAEQKGAIAVLVNRVIEGISIPQLCVDDCVLALQKIAQFWRGLHTLSTCVLVTGSNGKTSVKDMLTACFSSKMGRNHVCATKGNLNNHLGLPLSLLSLESSHQIGIFEVGANHQGEIAQLAPIAQPACALITSIGFAHIGEFGGLEAIKSAKAELLSTLPYHGLAVVPVMAVDDPLDAWEIWQSSIPDATQLVAFGKIDDLQIGRGWHRWVGLVATELCQSGDRLSQTVHITSSDWGSAKLYLPILGQHQAMNLVAVSALLLTQGFSWAQIQAGIMDLMPSKGRLQVSHLMEHCLLIDDSYNANPSSMIAAIQVLTDIAVDYRILVLGDMAELGDSAEAGHYRVGEVACTLGIDQLWVMGRYVDAYERGFGQKTQKCVDHDGMVSGLWVKLQSLMDEQKTCAILVKGSRSSQMEKVIFQLQATYQHSQSESTEIEEKK